MRAVAILAVRNEAIHIRRCLRDLIAENLDVILIDHASTDDTMARARPFLGRGLVAIHDMPWTGSFSLSEQLSFKRQVLSQLSYDWAIHVDADEHLHTIRDGESLRDLIVQADSRGFNCINFNEFVFVPGVGENFEVDNYSDLMTRYYYFRPSHPRLMRAQKLSAGLDNSGSGGHRLVGTQIALYPEDQVLRHYIMLSEEQGRRKYVGRAFAAEDLAKGWHRNRLVISEENLRSRTSQWMKSLPETSSRAFEIDHPAKTHFWQWPAA